VPRGREAGALRAPRDQRATGVRVRALYFAGLREALGQKEESLDLAEGSTLADLVERLRAQHEPIAAYGDRLVIAVNTERRPPATALAEGDEVAFLPPMSGGLS